MRRPRTSRQSAVVADHRRLVLRGGFDRFDGHLRHLDGDGATVVRVPVVGWVPARSDGLSFFRLAGQTVSPRGRSPVTLSRLWSLSRGLSAMSMASDEPLVPKQDTRLRPLPQLIFASRWL